MKRAAIAVLLVALASSAFAKGLKVGEQAPKFTLHNAIDDTLVDVDPVGPMVVVAFLSGSCRHSSAAEPVLIDAAKRYEDKYVHFYAVESTDPRWFRQAHPRLMREYATDHKFPFPFLSDPSGDVARTYGARVTPEVFVIDAEGVLRYRGAAEGMVAAIDALLANQPVVTASTKTVGCKVRLADWNTPSPMGVRKRPRASLELRPAVEGFEALDDHDVCACEVSE